MLPLINIAFADQGDIQNGPVGFKFNFSPDGLRRMAKFGWGDPANGATITLDELAVLAENDRETPGQFHGSEDHTPGKNIEVYVVRGSLPEAYLEDNHDMENWYGQLQIIAFYTDEKKNKQGVVLYRKKEDDSSLKFHTAKPVENRALGRGTCEALIHPQIWTNFSEIHKMNMLEAGSKSLLQTDDDAFVNRGRVQDMENLEVLNVGEGKRIDIIPTINPTNLQLHAQSIDEWFAHAQLAGAAQDPIMGKEAVSGTTFRGQERTVAQGRGPHDRKRGKRAKFVEQLYREFIIPKMTKEITSGKKFLATLSTEELQWISEQLATKFANDKLKAMLFEGKLPSEEERQILKDTFKRQFAKKGNKQLLEVLKGEMKGVDIKMGINVANKQKDLANLSDKLLSVFQFVFTNPAGFQQAMQIPALAKSFQDILEFSGLNQSDFLSLTQPPEQPQSLVEPTAQPAELTLNQNATEPATTS